MAKSLAEIEKIGVGDKVIANGAPVFVIAEVGINHNGEVKLAEKLIRAAKGSGADAVKFQTYVTEKRVKKDSPIFGILKQCELSYADQKKIAAFAASEGICFFSTPFDEESVDFLADLNVPLMKVASFDVVNLKLLRQIAAAKIPVIMSRGMANTSEIDRAVEIFSEGQVPYVLLHCVSSYPNKDENVNLRVMQTLRDTYGCLVGYSDHTLGIEAPVLSVAAGAVAIEKHFTLDRKMKGPDHGMSCDPKTMKEMVARVRQAESILGDSEIKLFEAEKGTVMYRRPSA